MSVLNLCSNFIFSSLYYDYYKNFIKYDENSIVFCPVRKNTDVNSNNMSYMKYNDISLLNNKNIIVEKIFNKFDSFFYFSKRRKYLRILESKDVIKNINFTIAHSTFTDGYIAYKIFKKYNINYAVFLQNGDINFFLKYIKILKPIFWKIIKNAKNIVVCSNSIALYVCNKYLNKKQKEVFLSKIKIIPFGLNDFYLNSKFKKETSLNKITFITAATINENKNQVSVAEAISRLRQNDGYDVEYILVGNVASEKCLSQLKKYDFVSYKGSLPKEDLINEYRKSDIFIMPSHNETFGLVYVEALSQGLPLIYSMNQGFDKQFPDNYIGNPVDSYSITSIYEGIKKNIQNYFSLSNNCHEAANLFSWGKIAKMYFDLSK